MKASVASALRWGLIAVLGCRGLGQPSGDDVVDAEATEDVSPDVAPPLDANADKRRSDSAARQDAPRDTPVEPVDKFYGTSHCQKPNTLFCEDFEGGGLDGKVWSFYHETATAQVDSARAARGRYALHINVAGKNANPWNHGMITTKTIYAVAGSHLFVRAFVYLEKLTPRHFTVMTAQGTDSAPGGGDWNYQINVVPDNLSASKFRSLWGYGATFGEQYADAGPPLGKWACWEWEIRGATNEQAVSVDDQPVPGYAIDASKMWIAPQKADLRLGFATSHTDTLGPQGFDIWLDDIAVGNQRIGCQ